MFIAPLARGHMLHSYIQGAVSRLNLWEWAGPRIWSPKRAASCVLSQVSPPTSWEARSEIATERYGVAHPLPAKSEPNCGLHPLNPCQIGSEACLVALARSIALLLK